MSKSSSYQIGKDIENIVKKRTVLTSTNLAIQNPSFFDHFKRRSEKYNIHLETTGF